MDLYKNDVFSIGITLYKIVTGKSIVGINDFDENHKIFTKEIYQLKIPI